MSLFVYNLKSFYYELKSKNIYSLQLRLSKKSLACFSLQTVKCKQKYLIKPQAKNDS